jgi:hypothetical protein
MVLAKKWNSVVLDDEYYSFVRGLTHRVEEDELPDSLGRTVCGVDVCCLKTDMVTLGWGRVVSVPVNCLYCVADRGHY